MLNVPDSRAFLSICRFIALQLISWCFSSSVGKDVGKMGKLNLTIMKTISEAGRYGDGDGLYLVVSKTGSRSWICRVQKDGRRRDVGIGSEKKVKLADARERAANIRRLVESGLDPIIERKKAAGIPTFKQMAIKMLEFRKNAWRNEKHKAQWFSTLNTYVFPKIGNISVDKIDSAHVRDCIMPIWYSKHETARRVLQRIMAVIDWAVGERYRKDSIPMSLVKKGFDKDKKIKPKHHAALPIKELPKFVSRLREVELISRLAFEFLILTATRSGEIRKASWSEIDLDEKIWIIPAERMKAGNEHVIPLSIGALSVLERAKKYRHQISDLIFPSVKSGKEMSDMTLTKICRDMKINAVPHGFRSTFRDWVAEKTDFDPEVAEMALAHTISNKVEAAYRRGNLVGKREKLMEAWCEFCLSENKI